MSWSILLVDDEAEILSALSRDLHADGYRILSAQSAQAALEILERESVAVVLSDQRMPAMSGMELLIAIRQRYPDVVRMVLSGHTDLDVVMTALNDGAVYKYLTKPWKRETLRASLQDAVQQYALQQERKRLVEEIEMANATLEQLNHELLNLVVSKDEALAYASSYDAVTGLPNRMLFVDRVQQSLAHARRDERCVAVISLNLDGFGAINDTYGQALGDALLRAVAERLGARLRSGDTLARTSGNGFSIMLADLTQPDDTEVIVSDLLAQIEQPFVLNGDDFFVAATIGISTAPMDGDDAQTLTRKADSALHYAKTEARGAYRFYAEEVNREVRLRLSLEGALRRAVERSEFELFYQPQCNLESGFIVGVEALIRWRRPEQGLISPLDFIPALEHTGLIVPVGEWVLRTACAQAHTWRKAGFYGLRMAVNLSVLQFRQTDLVGMVERILRDTGVDPFLHALELELTESLLMRDVERNIATLHRLVEMGIKLSVDDFGTGYSSLSYLRRFPIHALKIDRSFVQDMVENADDAAIVGAVIALGHSLRLNVIAEGVETEKQRTQLRILGCDEMQGFLISRPLPPDELLPVLRARAGAECIKNRE